VLAPVAAGRHLDSYNIDGDERGNVIGIVSAKLDASTALAMSGSLPENVNYAVKSSLLLSFLGRRRPRFGLLTTKERRNKGMSTWLLCCLAAKSLAGGGAGAGLLIW
jgi:hypothetical protein